MNITEAELQALRDCKSEVELEETFNQLRYVRGGEDPSDMYDRVIHSGLYDQITSQFVSSFTEEVQLDIVTI
jgi:hypothetical protein